MPEHAANPRLIALGGVKGGVGVSLFAAGLAAFFAQLGKRVLYLDAHPQGPAVAASLGATSPDASLPPWAPAPSDPRGRETAVPGIRVVECTREDGAVPELPLRRPRELLKGAAADFALLDLGAGVRSRTLDAMLDADAVVAVTTPEPVAVEAVWRLARHLYARAVTARLREAGDHDAVAAVAELSHQHAGPPMPVDLAAALAARSQEAGAVAWGALASVRLRLVVNQSRSRADLELGEAMARVSARRLGPVIDYLGHVEHDDAAVVAARRRRPLLVDAPAAKASRNLERVARRLLSLESRLSAPPPAGPAGAPEPATHYETLGVDRGASDEEIRRAYRRTREVFAAESVCLAGLLTEPEVSAMVARVEEARDVLLDPSRRRPYDLSITPPGELPMATGFDDEPEAAAPAAPAAPMPAITPDTEFTGALLREVRVARGSELRDVSARTKVSIAYLRAIEDDDHAALPAAVYARGFVAEYAKFLKLDVEQVVRTWLRRYRKATER
ncbi:MAG: helix-turn-helix domain-containing protein [Polyangiales bacterium]